MKKSTKFKLGALTLGVAIAAGPVLALTSCSSAANPHGPDIVVNVTRGEDSNNLLVDNKDSSAQNTIEYILETANSTLERQTEDKNVEFKNINDASKAYIDADKDTSKQTIPSTYFNEYLISTIATQEVMSVATNLITFATEGLATNKANGEGNFGITNWGKTVYDNDSSKRDDLANLREFCAAWLIGGGTGSNTYHLWPKNVNFTLGFDQKLYNNHDKFMTPGAGSTTTEPKIEDVARDEVRISNITIDYSWYKTSKSGGAWANVEDVASHTNSVGTWSNLNFTPAVGSTPITISPSKNTYTISLGDIDLLLKATYTSETDENDVTTYTYTGQETSAAPLKKNTDDNSYSEITDGSIYKMINLAKGDPSTKIQTDDDHAYDNTKKIMIASSKAFDLKKNNLDEIVKEVGEISKLDGSAFYNTILKFDRSSK